MIHRYEQGTNGKTIVLFHGTGGTELDLILLAKNIDPNANILSFRGRVSEQGMNRFFKRLSPGVFDLESLRNETRYYIDQLEKLALRYDFSLECSTLIGYSNGANIIASMLLHQKEVFNHAVLIRPMVPLRDAPMNDLSNANILILSGLHDPIVAHEEVSELKDFFQKRHANLSIEWKNAGHQIDYSDVDSIKKWYLLLDFHNL